MQNTHLCNTKNDAFVKMTMICNEEADLVILMLSDCDSCDRRLNVYSSNCVLKNKLIPNFFSVIVFVKLIF